MPPAGSDLGAAGQLLTNYMMDETELADYLAGAQVITDDRALFLPAQEMDAILKG